MAECPAGDGGCKKIRDLSDEIWGIPGRPNTGLKDCVKKKVPKLWLWVFVAVFGGMILTGGVTVLSAVERTERNEKQLEKLIEIVQKNEVERTKINEQVKAIYEEVVKKNYNRGSRYDSDSDDG